MRIVFRIKNGFLRRIGVTLAVALPALGALGGGGEPTNPFLPPLDPIIISPGPSPLPVPGPIFVAPLQLISVAVTSPTNGAVFKAPGEIQIAAQASVLQGFVHTVEFFANDHSLGVTTNNPTSAAPVNPFQLAWATPSPGQYALTARALSSLGLTATSSPVNINVTESSSLSNGFPIVTVVATDPTASVVGPSTALVTFSRTGDTFGSLTVRFRLSGTATNNVDYELPGAPNGNSVVIPAGSHNTSVILEPRANHLQEETVVLDLTTNALYQIGSPSEAVVTILGAPAQDYPTVNLVATDPTATRPVAGATATDLGTFTVYRTDATNSALVIPYRITGTAVGGVDYVAVSGSLSIGKGVLSKTITVQPLPGAGNGDSRTVSLTLLPSTCELNVLPPGPGCYRLGPTNSATVTILFPPAAPGRPTLDIVATDPSASRPPTGGVATDTGVFTIYRHGDTNAELSIRFSVGGSAVNGVDYTALPVTITMPRGMVTATLTVAPHAAGPNTGPATVTVTLLPAVCPQDIVPLPPTCYLVGSTNSATVNISASTNLPPPSATWPALGVEPTALGMFVIDGKGQLYAWGSNQSGELGTGDKVDRAYPTPILIPAGDTWTTVSSTAWNGLTGEPQTFGIDGRGRLWGWGGNDGGLLGTPTGNSSRPPTPALINPLPNGVTGWISVVTGHYGTYAIASDGRLFGWGHNGPTLGTGDQIVHASPTPVVTPGGLTGWKAITAASEYSRMAIGADDQLYSWGLATNGQIRAIPERVAPPDGVTAWLAVASETSNVVALANTGLIYSWNSDINHPIHVPLPEGVSGWRSVDAAQGLGWALSTDGELYRWPLGIVPMLPVSVPFPDGVTNWTAFAAAGGRQLAIGSDCNLYAWGSDSDGYLGLYCTPQQLASNSIVQLPTLVNLPNLCTGAARSPTVTVTSPSNLSVFSPHETVQITTAICDPAATIASVRFYLDGQIIGARTSVPYSWELTNPPAGEHELRVSAVTPGGTVFSSAITISVIAIGPLVPQVTITNPTNGAIFPEHANILITANATSGHSIIRADFYSGEQLLGTKLTAPYTLIWSNVLAGNYTLTAESTDALGVRGGSAPVNISVRAAILPTVSVSAAVQSIPVSGTNSGAFLISRSGDTSLPLTVAYALGGTTVNGVGYEHLPGTVTIPPGSTLASVVVKPIRTAVLPRIATVILSLPPPNCDVPGLVSPGCYRVGASNSATIYLFNLAGIRPTSGGSELTTSSIPLATSLSALVAPDGRTLLGLTGTPDQIVEIDASTDFLNWDTLAVLTNVTGTTLLADPSAGQFGYRFYRLHGER